MKNDVLETIDVAGQYPQTVKKLKTLLEIQKKQEEQQTVIFKVKNKVNYRI
ncbi:MAG: hypothetical protein ABFS16_12090 [Bacteroidota bacterium]